MRELTTKEIQLVSLEILRKVVDICEELNLHYFLMYGTLIGAIRHKGFIPWDDDLDIMMPRNDYMKLISYFMSHEEEMYPLELFSNYNINNYPYMIGRISDSGYTLKVDNEKDYGIGVFIDIYPLDGVGNDEKEMKGFFLKADRLSSLCYLSTRNRCRIDNTKSKIRLILKFPAFVYAKSMGKAFFEKRINKLVTTRKYEENKYVGCTVWLSGGIKDVFLKKDLEETIKVTFENYEFKVPKNYDKILTSIYGDYMKLPPEDERIGHHWYRAYKKE